MSRSISHRKVYRRLRDEVGLSSQMTIRAIRQGRRRDENEQEESGFSSSRGCPIRPTNVRLRGDVVSISTVEGRKRMKVKVGEFQRKKMATGVVKAGMKLCYRGKRFFLAVVVERETPPLASSGVLGVDLGIANIATDSEGHLHEW